MKNLKILILILATFACSNLFAQGKLNFGLTASPVKDLGWNAYFNQTSKEADINTFSIYSKKAFNLGGTFEYEMGSTWALNAGSKFTSREVEVAFANKNSKWIAQEGASDQFVLTDPTQRFRMNFVEVPVSVSYKIPMKGELYHNTNFVITAGGSADVMISDTRSIEYSSFDASKSTQIGSETTFTANKTTSVTPAVDFGLAFEDFTGSFGKMRVGVSVHHQLQKPMTFDATTKDYVGEALTTKTQSYELGASYISLDIKYFLTPAE